MTALTALVANGAEKHYGDERVVGPIHLVVERGERVALIGANGSGKTTFLRMAAGLLEISEGWIHVEGEPAGSLAARAAVSFIADAPVFYDDLSLAEHLEYIAGLHGVAEWHEPADSLVRRLRIADRMDDLPSTFSRGLRQKAAIAIGFVRPFSVLLVDEPYVGLDTAGRDAFDELLDDAHAGGAAVVVATHQFDRLPEGTRCVVLQNGDIVHDGPATQAQLTAFVEG